MVFSPWAGREFTNPVEGIHVQTGALDVSEAKAQQTAQPWFLQAKGQIWVRHKPKLGTVVPGGHGKLGHAEPPWVWPSRPGPLSQRPPSS